MPHDILHVARRLAWDVVCSSDPWEQAMAETCLTLFDDDVALHVVSFSRGDAGSVGVRAWVDLPEPRAEVGPALLAAAARHPSVAALSSGKTTPDRLSDFLDLPRFRQTETFAQVHGHPAGTRFACAAPLHRSSTAFVLLGAHRRRHDFDAQDMAAVELVQRIVAPALTVRFALEAVAGRAADGQPSPVPLLPVGGVRRPAGADEYWPTPRERQVLSLVVAGLTNRQIGRRLDVTERTVRKHLDSVYHRAGLLGRAAAAAWWVRRSER